jgi:hypothetical protein
MDWETAGIGIPTIDVAVSKVDVDAYWRLMRKFCPDLDLKMMKNLTEVAKILRNLAAINWEAQSLPFKWIRKPMTYIELFHTRLTDALQNLRLLD